MSGYGFAYSEQNTDRVVRTNVPSVKMRNYDAAKSSDLFHGWGVNNSTADALLWKSLAAIRARSREMMRNNPYAKRFKRMAVSNIIGPNGIRLQNKATDANGSQDKMANDMIEAGWRNWSVNCMTNGMSLRMGLSLAVGNTVSDGEVLIRIKRGFGPYGIKLQLIEADHLPEHFNDVQRNIRMGVEHDDNGAPIAYHLYKNHPGDSVAALSQEIVRVPADEIIHFKAPDRISQSRGVPWMHAAMTGLKMLGGYEEAELVAARLGAAKGGFYKKPQGEQYEQYDEKGNNLETEEGDPIQEITPGMYETLPAGWDFVQFDPTHPTSAFRDFSKAILRGISSGFDVSYNYLSNDLEGVNYSSIRAGVLDERDMWMMMQSWVIESGMYRIYTEFLKMAMLTQAIPLPMRKFNKFNAPVWMPRRWQWVDPQKDMTANVLAVKAGFKAPSMVVAEMGYDLEDVYAAISRDKKMREEYGITDINDAELMQLLDQINNKD